MISCPLTAAEVLEREFLNIRAKILEVGALLDRLDRAEGDLRDDPRYQRIARALEVLQQEGTLRAEQIQMIFSLDYDQSWRERFAAETPPGETRPAKPR